MNEFERAYYESPEFWKGEMLQDEANVSRFAATEALIPNGVKKVVDVGCGNGVFVNRLVVSKPEVEVFAVDRSAKALEFVKCNKTQGEITSIPFPDRYFDCVTCLEVIEHLGVNDFRLALGELARVSNKFIIVSVPFDEKIEESYTKCPSCKSIFNYQLHLQSFGERKFIGLFDQLGYRNVSFQKMNLTERYRGHFQYRKLFYPEQLTQWRSPICPLCGYFDESADEGDPTSRSEPAARRKLISYLGQLPKLFWPKEKSYYWILGLFEKVSK